MRFFKNSVKVYTCVSRILSQTRYKVLINVQSNMRQRITVRNITCVRYSNRPI